MSPHPGTPLPGCRCDVAGAAAACARCDAALILSAVLDGFALIGAVRDEHGEVIDFDLLQLKAPSSAGPAQRDAYAAAVEQRLSVLSAMPALASNGLFADMVTVLLRGPSAGRGGTLWRDAVPHRDITGAECYLEVSISKIDDERVAVAWRDATTTVTAQKELWESLEQLCEREALHRTVLDTLDEAVILRLTGGSVAMVNYAAQALFDVSGARDEMAECLRALRFEHPDGTRVDAHEHPFTRPVAGGTPQIGAVYRVRRDDGSLRWVSTTVIPLHAEPGGPVTGLVITCADISLERLLAVERDRHDAEIRRMNAKLRQAQAVRDQMVAVASHELRTPLTAILGYTSLLLEAEQAPEATAEVEDSDESSFRHSSLSRISAAARRLERLVDDLLVLSSLDAGGLRLDLADVAVDALVRDTVESFPRSTEIVVDVPLGLTMRADGGRLTQIVSNLLTNAFKYGEPPVSVRADLVGSWIDLRVSDSGPGVPAGSEAAIFGQFEQVSPRSDGVGLGLWIVRALAEAHGGTAFYERGTPTGACFVIRLPVGGPAGTAAVRLPFALASVLSNTALSNTAPSNTAGLLA
jgi:PAS domain S-box-containing protein